MSGGVDSSVAAARLVELGYDVTSLMLRLWSEPGEGAHNRCCTPQAVKEARRVAQLLDIPFQWIDAEQSFKARVVDMFVEEHARGCTPNPCVSCNKAIKFGFLMRRARTAGADALATGHYAQVSAEKGTYELRRAADPRKDQSYFLYALDQEQLSHVLFPLGAFTKSHVRAMAEELKLPVADREESQDLCFIRDHDVQRFLRSYAPDILQRGPILDEEGRELGEHQGLALYTIGQRRGIGVTWSEPLYVLEKDVRRNALVVAPSSRLGRRRFQVGELSFVAGHAPSLPARVGVKIRYKGRQTEAVLRPAEGTTVTVHLEESLRDVTPGQAAVFYRGVVVLGGGLITRTI